jgi:hypothetical protein
MRIREAQTDRDPNADPEQCFKYKKLLCMHGYAPYVVDSVTTEEGSPEYPRHLRNFCSHSLRAAAVHILLFKKGYFDIP